MLYTSWAKAGPGVSLALTRDFRSFQRLGFVLPPENKDATLLPRRIGDRWAMIHRPRAAGQPAHIWIAYSPDLRHWGDHAVLMPAKRGPWWDANKIGLSTPLIETDQGWLMIYHGVKTTVAGAIYRLGLALLDLEDPRRVLLRGNQWIFGPEADYELTGDVANITFPCGYTLGDDGDTLSLYYGAADTSIALATGSIGEMLDWLRTNSETDPAAL